MVIREQELLQRHCPFASALTQLVPYQHEELKMSKKALLQHELIFLARAMSFAGAGWSNLLQSKWPVFGILRRVRERLFQPGMPAQSNTNSYYKQLDASADTSLVLALSNLNSSDDCLAAVTARLHLALLAEATPDVSGFAQSPQAQLVDAAEQEAVRCDRKLLPRLQRLLTSRAPILKLLHEIWQKLRPRGWTHLADQALARKPTSLTLNACLCELDWQFELVNGSHSK
eukprot:g28392.t1